MKILDAQVDWREDVGNDPRLQVVVDEDCHLERRVKFSSEEPYWILTRDKGGDA